jgi:hypothetical protein
MSSPKLAECPLCGYSAGVYIAAKTDCSAATPVRCLFCRGQAPLDRWLKSGKTRSERTPRDARA